MMAGSYCRTAAQAYAAQRVYVPYFETQRDEEEEGDAGVIKLFQTLFLILSGERLHRKARE